MKNIFKFGLFALFVSMAACSDATDIIQESELNEEAAFKTVADLQSGLNAVYAAYGPDFGGNGSGDSILFNDLFTDNFKRGERSSGQGSTEYNFILQPNTDMAASIWGNRYATINRVNRTLRAYERIYVTLPEGDKGKDPIKTSDDLEDKMSAERIKGQLLAMRAMCHFDLFQYYTPDYENPAGLSIIKVDFVPNITDEFERNTVEEIVTFIKDDINQSRTLLGDTNMNNVNFFNADVLKALEARLAITIGDYATAGTLAQQLLNDYPLSAPEQYVNMFLDVVDGEVIFSLIRTTNDNGIGANWYANAGLNDPFFEMSQQLFDLYDDGDVRRRVNAELTGFEDDDFLPTTYNDPESFDMAGSLEDPNIILIAKYRGTATAMNNDVKVFRSSEMLLILAEVQARSGQLALAAESIQALRTARYTFDLPAAPEFLTEGAALTTILEERRKELAFEGHRYLDLKRFGVGVSRLPSDAATFSGPTLLGANDYRFTMPIPQTELNANNVITQNPGYPVNN